MRRNLVAIFLFLCVLMSGMLLYAGATLRFHNKPEYTEYKTSTEITLDNVKKTNIEIQPNVEYSLVYTLRSYHYTKGVVVKNDLDTLGISVLAIRQSDQGGYPSLPSIVILDRIPH